MDVRASEETVRAGQPFNVTCTGPPGPGFQQQWLHPKSQARRETLFLQNSGFGFSAASSRYKCPPRLRVTSFPAALNLKLANNGFGA